MGCVYAWKQMQDNSLRSGNVQPSLLHTEVAASVGSLFLLLDTLPVIILQGQGQWRQSERHLDSSSTESHWRPPKIEIQRS